MNRTLPLVASLALLYSLALIGGCNPNVGSDLNLSAQDYQTLSTGQSIAQVVPVTVPVGTQQANVYLIVGVNANPTSIAAALQAINVAPPGKPQSVLLPQKLTIPPITIHTPSP